LDDELAQAPPAWSPDSSKVATAFDVNIGIYDAAEKAPTQARIELREKLLIASAVFESKQTGKSETPTPGNLKNAFFSSFNPIIRIEWLTPEKLYIQTAFVRRYKDPTIKPWFRWHLVTLSPQAAVLGR
jgi:hypothetical protein